MMMTRAEYDYFSWLVSQIEIPNNTYEYVLERMYELEFTWTVPNDHNRVQDGLDLRLEYSNGIREELENKGVSLLEVLIALSRRASFTGGGSPEVWAWKLLKNLGLSKMSDPLTPEQALRVDEILDTLIWRTYKPDGRGGFFPLKNPVHDQREVEIWYQMNSYIIESHRS